MVVIGDHVAVDATLLAHECGETLVPRLDGAPGCLQKVDPARHHLPSGRHAWQRACVVVVKDGTPFRQPVDVRSDRKISSVATQVMPVQGIHDDEDGSHWLLLRLSVVVGSSADEESHSSNTSSVCAPSMGGCRYTLKS